MRSIILFTLLNFILTTSCYVTPHKNAVGITRQTLSKEKIFAYEKGYSAIVFEPIDRLKRKSNNAMISMKFQDTYYVGALGNIMYENFGKWDTIYVMNNLKKPMLI